MKRLLILFSVFLALLIIGCEKDNFLVHSSDPLSSIDHYFDFSFASSTVDYADGQIPPLPGVNHESQLETRSIDSNWVLNTVIPTVDSLNNLYNFLPDWVNNIGYAYWDKTAFSSFSNTAFIPFGRLNQNQVSAFLVVNEYQGDLRFRFVLREPLVQNAQLDILERRSWYLYGKIMSSLEYDIFGVSTLPISALTPRVIDPLTGEVSPRCEPEVIGTQVNGCWLTYVVPCETDSWQLTDVDCTENNGQGGSNGGTTTGSSSFWNTGFFGNGSTTGSGTWWNTGGSGSDDPSGGGGSSGSNDDHNNNDGGSSPPGFGNFDLPEFNNQLLEQVFNNILADNEALRNFSEEFENAPPWLWPIVREIAAEMIISIIEKQLKLNLADDVKDLIRSIGQQDLYGFVKEAIDIVATFHPGVRAVDAIWETSVYAQKAFSLINKVKSMASSLGNEAMEKLWNALNANGRNLLEDLDVSDWPLGIRLKNTSIGEFWDNLVDAFDVSPNDVIDYTSNGHPAKRFQVSGMNFAMYFSSSGYWTITINGNEYKFRFD